ncbi:hypothetical protein Ae263Ps1_2628 [Pseudonocardia sp. Ae263_Ps1]|nr:hypothetical protein Ae150APs1_2701 [Pseudonocardia sp. Ae150A_Ps1]OLL85573.1 hypothetical protein Ae263Ps1_2628 [Pseudonocardia sp. Ae263_Ps1]OLL94403.1 hypothetical protein Ae356Ps1_4300 [Pseudonocardia sp. Ae356_Ps1]
MGSALRLVLVPGKEVAGEPHREGAGLDVVDLAESGEGADHRLPGVVTYEVDRRGGRDPGLFLLVAWGAPVARSGVVFSRSPQLGPVLSEDLRAAVPP